MPTPTDHERLAHFVHLIGAAPRQAEFDEEGNLIKLNLAGLGLRELPPEIGEFVWLEVLILGQTHVISLREIRLENNPWRTPPPELALAGVDEVLNFLRALQTGNVAIRYQAKLLIVGEGAAGKSSVLRALRGLTFNEKLETTHGIDIQPYQLLHHQYADINITLNAWDFGGQQIYHTTHQFFMTRRSLYLLVWNARVGIAKVYDETFYKQIELNVELFKNDGNLLWLCPEHARFHGV